MQSNELESIWPWNWAASLSPRRCAVRRNPGKITTVSKHFDDIRAILAPNQSRKATKAGTLGDERAAPRGRACAAALTPATLTRSRLDSGSDSFIWICIVQKVWSPHFAVGTYLSICSICSAGGICPRPPGQQHYLPCLHQPDNEAKPKVQALPTMLKAPSEETPRRTLTSALPHLSVSRACNDDAPRVTAQGYAAGHLPL